MFACFNPSVVLSPTAFVEESCSSLYSIKNPLTKMIYIANWKSNKTSDQAKEFFQKMKQDLSKYSSLESNEVVVAPSFTLLFECKNLIESENLPIELAAQNVSPFPPGAYTGEINARQLKELVKFVIIGHSERRTYFHESESDIENKIRESKEAGLKTVQCIQNEHQSIYGGADYVAYEPPSAIGTGNPDDPEHISEIFSMIKRAHPNTPLLYGGSVNPQNIQDFKSIEGLAGFLIGGASLDANSFISLLP